MGMTALCCTQLPESCAALRSYRAEVQGRQMFRRLEDHDLPGDNIITVVADLSPFALVPCAQAQANLSTWAPVQRHRTGCACNQDRNGVAQTPGS